jgi:Tat protein translocase TatB subunit
VFNIGSQELLVILVIALIVVGPQRLPELSRSIGKGLRELRKVQDDMKDMVKFDLEPDRDTPPRSRRPASPTAPGVHRTPKPAPAAQAAPAEPSEPAAPPRPAAPEATAPAVDEQPSDG